MLGYADPAGEGPLREAISRRMRVHGVDVSPDEVVVTAGAQSALDRCLRLLAKPGSRPRRQVHGRHRQSPRPKVAAYR